MRHRIGPFWRLAILACVIISTALFALAQRMMLWQGSVKPVRINVYSQASTSVSVVRTLSRGQIVNVVLEVRVLNDAWCRIVFPDESEPIGYVLCMNLAQTQSGSKRAAHNESPQPSARTASATTPAAEAASADSSVLRDKDILEMNKIGLTSDVLVAKIKSSPCNFDTSPAQLQLLKSSGVSDAVILAMVQARPVAAAAPEAASVAPQPETPVAASAVAQEMAHSAPSSNCVILKRMGPADQITSHLYAYGIRGKQFQFVEGQLPPGVSFHGRLTDHDVRKIQREGRQSACA